MNKHERCKLTDKDWLKIFDRARNLKKLREQLASQTPIYDELFLRDYDPRCWWALKGDERLLKPVLRRELKWLRKFKFVLSPRKNRRNRKRLDVLESMLVEKVKDWVKSLPPKERRRERRRRFRTSPFLGRHKTAPWPIGADQVIRSQISIGRPDLLAGWETIPAAEAGL